MASLKAVSMVSALYSTSYDEYSLRQEVILVQIKINVIIIFSLEYGVSNQDVIHMNP